jgi:hypothetical protein
MIDADATNTYSGINAADVMGETSDGEIVRAAAAGSDGVASCGGGRVDRGTTGCHDVAEPNGHLTFGGISVRSSLGLIGSFGGDGGSPPRRTANLGDSVSLARNKSTKICRKCDRKLSLRAFYRDRSSRDGRTAWCKKCRRQSSAAAYRANPRPEVNRRRSADYRRRTLADPDRASAYMATRLADHRRYELTPKGKAARARAEANQKLRHSSTAKESA